MKSKTHLTWLAITALGVMAGRTLPQDLGELELMNCEVTIRPRGSQAPTTTSYIVWGVTDHGPSTTELALTTDANTLEIADSRGNNKSLLPEGENKLMITTTSGVTTLTVTDKDGNAVGSPLGLITTGTYDDLAPLQEPVGEMVTPDPATGNERARISVTNGGLTSHFVIVAY